MCDDARPGEWLLAFNVRPLEAPEEPLLEESLLELAGECLGMALPPLLWRGEGVFPLSCFDAYEGKKTY